MKRFALCLLGFFVLATPALAAPIVQVQSSYLGGGLWGHWVFVDPNSGLDENTFIDTTIMADTGTGGKLEQFLDRTDYGQVNLTSEQPLASALDPTYPAGLDTVFDDSAFPGVVQVDLVPLNVGLPYVPPPSPQPSLNGNTSMRVQAASFTGGLGGPIISGQLTPIWHAVTWGNKLWISGTLQTDSNPNSTFEAHVPEPATALLAGMGLALIGVVRRRRK